MNKKIAVILPVYKNDKVEYMTLSINSILNQTYKDFHLYIGVDGPVGDDIKDFLHQYDNAENVTVVWFETNRGLACVLNDLLELSFKQGFEYIARMDADDISLPNRFELQMSFFDKHSDIDVIGGWVSLINEMGANTNKIVHYPENSEESFKLFATRNPLSHPTVMFRISFFDKAGCLYRPDHKKNQDTLLWYDGLMKDVKIGNVQDVILKFRATNDMYSNRRSGKKQAKIQLKDRMMINKGLKYGIKADLYAYCVYLTMIAPTWLRKGLYSIFR